MATYLDFEQKIRNLQDDIESALMRGDDDAKHILEKELEKEVANVYANISDYQRLQLARHPDRPYAMDYIELICKDAYEINGDRHFKDDKAIVCFLGKIGGQTAMVIGEEKGRGEKSYEFSGGIRDFGHPQGIRKETGRYVRPGNRCKAGGKSGGGAEETGSADESRDTCADGSTGKSRNACADGSAGKSGDG